MTKGIIKTDKGDFPFDLYDTDAPGTVKNFVDLSKKGFYNGLSFHRVIPGFVAQGGCPDGTGAGGPGYTIPCETGGGNQFHDAGVLSMAHAGRNTGGSQFFICHNRQNTQHLDRNHTCFGRITENLGAIQNITPGTIINQIEILE